MDWIKTHLIAVIEDEADIVNLISIHLKRSGFRVVGFSSFKSFSTFLNEQIPDLLILDLMLPDADGLDICKYLKTKDEFRSIPIIMLTAKDGEMDKILGLELGADDYVTKPFSPKELVARVKAVLRRRIKPTDERSTIRIGKLLKIDLEKYEVAVDGKPIELTSAEFRLLQLLASRKGRVFSRDSILDYLWGNEKAVIDRTVDVHINNLRKKLGGAKTLIKNIRGIGYKLEE